MQVLLPGIKTTKKVQLKVNNKKRKENDYRLSFIAIRRSFCLTLLSNSASAAANSLSVDLVLRSRSDLIILNRCCNLFTSTTQELGHILMTIAFRCVMKVSLPTASIDGCCPECNVCTYVWYFMLACRTVITTYLWQLHSGM